MEKKRAAVGGTKNQALSHPICQHEGAGHIKNKLSDQSQGRRAEAALSNILHNGASSAMGVTNHKRHKSDIVESQRQSFQPLIGSNYLPQKGNVPQKVD